MIFYNSEPYELRGVESRTSSRGEYHVYHLEDSNGAPDSYYCKDTSLVSGFKKGDLLSVAFERRVYDNNTSLVIVNVSSWD